MLYVSKFWVGGLEGARCGEGETSSEGGFRLIFYSLL